MSRGLGDVYKRQVYYDEGPPVPIPNTVVKLTRAEDTWRAVARENRLAPTLADSHPCGWLFLFCQNLFSTVKIQTGIFARHYSKFYWNTPPFMLK